MSRLSRCGAEARVVILGDASRWESGDFRSFALVETCARLDDSVLIAGPHMSCSPLYTLEMNEYLKRSTTGVDPTSSLSFLQLFCCVMGRSCRLASKEPPLL